MAASTQADLLGNRYGHLAYRRRIIALSTGSTGTYQVPSRESGAIYRVGAISTLRASLPRVSSLALGLTYDFFVPALTSVTMLNIDTTNDSSAAISLAAGTSASSLTTASAISVASTLGQHYVSLTALSTVVWLGNVSYGIGFETTATAIIGENVSGGWAAGTTVA